MMHHPKKTTMKSKIKSSKIYQLCFLVLTINLLSSYMGQAQGLFGKNKKIDYLGQKPPGMNAELFAPGLISTDSLEHSTPAFSPDGNQVLWTLIYRGKPSFILEMKKENGAWSKPSRASFSDPSADDIYQSFSVDGKKLYFGSRRKMPSGYPEGKGIRIWEVARNADGWGVPVPFDTTVSKGEDYAHSPNTAGDMYFSFRRRGGAEFDIAYASKIGGKYASPIKLPYGINTMEYEDGPFIAPDGSYLIFESGRLSGIENSIDLYISFRNKDGSWKLPLNMGEKINTKYAERFARLSPDGKYLFFGSTKPQSVNSIGFDTYWIDAKIIAELKEQSRHLNRIDQQLGDEILATQYNRDYTKTAALLPSWLSQHPADLNAQYDLTLALRKSKQYELAEKTVMAQTTRWPKDLNFQKERVLITYAVGKPQEAESHLTSLIARVQQPAETYLSLANELYGMAKYRESASVYEKALAIRANGGDYYNLGCCYALLNEKNRAIEALEKAIDLGFNRKQQYETDTDLDALRTDARFQALLGLLK